MARWSALTDYLNQADDTCRLTWDELSGIVGGLPPSASRHRAWWSGDRPHVQAWRAAGFRVAALSMGRAVTFVRVDAPAPSPQLSPTVDWSLEVDTSPAVEVHPPGSHLVLISCSKSKLDHPAAAKDLYTSPLFRRARSFAEASGRTWFILSAEHGLVAPGEWLAPYERYLPDTARDFREAWGHWVVERLDLLVDGLAGRTVEIHAGSAYVEPIAERLHAKGCRASLPLEWLAVGQRLHWYAGIPPAAAADTAPAPPPDDGPVDPTKSPESFAEALRDEQAAVAPTAFLERGPSGLRVPGLYSWWADEQAAADLSEGVGHTVEPGMIYAGLAGATRWPSGKRSTNTLWARIAGMHLGKRHEFSTFRRTLGAIQAQRAGSTTVDEESLTQWMKAHLRVLAAPYEDADTLGRLETEVLRLLDPPLNLQGMPVTPVRRRLTELRRVLTTPPPSD